MATSREQFENLVSLMKEDEKSAINDLTILFGSDKFIEILNEIENIQERVIPNDGYDQILTNALQVLNSLKGICAGIDNSLQTEE